MRGEERESAQALCLAGGGLLLLRRWWGGREQRFLALHRPALPSMDRKPLADEFYRLLAGEASPGEAPGYNLHQPNRNFRPWICQDYRDEDDQGTL